MTIEALAHACTHCGYGRVAGRTTTAVIAGIALIYLDNWQHAVVVGMVLSLSSTAIVLQTLNEKGLMKNDSGQAFAVLLFQDIAVIPACRAAVVGGG